MLANLVVLSGHPDKEEDKMTYRPRKIVERTDASVHDTEVRAVEYAPSPLATVERWIVFIFGLIELLIGLRILLLLVAARESNDIVAFIYNVSDVFVAPFRGILASTRSRPARRPLTWARSSR